jgi:hypothetical protein
MWCYKMFDRIYICWLIRIVSTYSRSYFEIQITIIAPSIDKCIYPNKYVLLDVCQQHMAISEI